MKLLILTQKVNRDDPILGFFCRWITEFAKHFESIVVIALETQKETIQSLPTNVKVFSLGKENKFEKGLGKFKYILRFYKYIWSLRNEYDAVFVHMNQEYVLLGFILWKIFRKKIYMWRNHYSGNYMTRLSVWLCNKVFCTSKYSYTARFKKTKLMPVGVDTDFFKPIENITRNKNTILSLGRISSSKNIHILVDALLELDSEGVQFEAYIYGDALPKDLEYKKQLIDKVSSSGSKKILFCNGVPNYKTPEIYSTFDIFVNLSPSGMYDKTMFEAAACGCAVVAFNKDLLSEFGSDYVIQEQDKHSVAQKFKQFFDLNRPSKNLREITVKNQSLKLLATELQKELSISR